VSSLRGRHIHQHVYRCWRAIISAHAVTARKLTSLPGARAEWRKHGSA